MIKFEAGVYESEGKTKVSRKSGVEEAGSEKGREEKERHYEPTHIPSRRRKGPSTVQTDKAWARSTQAGIHASRSLHDDRQE